MPQEIKDKLDASKENLDDMCKTLTLPDDHKPGLVLKWMRKVSQNEIGKVHDEIFNFRLAEKKLKRLERYSMESLEVRGVSMSSQRSEIGSKGDSERYTAVKSRDTNNKVINYSGALGENNSACSKTSSNTKATPNLVRIPLSLEKGKSCETKCETPSLPYYMTKTPKIVSVEPAKSIVLKFNNVSDEPKQKPKPLKCKRNILVNMKDQDIVIENLDPERVVHKPHNFTNKQLNENENSIHIFSVGGANQDQESVNFNWSVNLESHDLNLPDQYMKEEPMGAKFCNVSQSNISQIMESVDDCGDFCFHKQMLPGQNDPLKHFNIGPHPMVMGQFSNNITPAFSLTEDLAEPLRPNGLELNEITGTHLEIPHNLPVFPSNADGDIMLS